MLTKYLYRCSVMNIKKFSILACLMYFTFLLNISYAEMPSNFPKIKPGLWETSMTMGGKNMPKVRQCVDEKMQTESEQASKDYEKKNCSNAKYSQSGNTFYAEVTCKGVDGKPMQTKTESTFVSVNELKTKVVSVYNGKTETMLNHTKRVGDCSTKEASSASVADDKGNMQSLDELLNQAKEAQKKFK